MPVRTTYGTLTEADRAWFATEVEALLPELYGRAVALCRHRANAEDLVADAVAKGWEALPSLADRAAFRGWVFRILNNVFVSFCRSARAKAEHEPLDGEAEEFSLFERLHQPFLLWWGNPEIQFLNRLLRDDLQRAIDALPDTFREVVVLVDVQGLTYAEVAALLAVPVGTVRSRLARGRSRLQRALWEHGKDAGLVTGPADRAMKRGDAT
jgi:RNA polymerase sigma-70 factor, ECF subfamily